MTFKEAVLSDKAKLSDIDDWVERWHETDVNGTNLIELHEYLGFTDKQYAQWVEYPEDLHLIVFGW